MVTGLAGGFPDDGETDYESRRLLAVPELAAVPLAAAAFLLAHHFSYDAYYAPTLRRFSTASRRATWSSGGGRRAVSPSG